MDKPYFNQIFPELKRSLLGVRFESKSEVKKTMLNQLQALLHVQQLDIKEGTINVLQASANTLKSLKAS